MIRPAVFVLLLMGLFVLSRLFNLEKFNRRYAPRTPPITTSNRQPFSFSLKTLFIAMAMIAILLGLMVFMEHLARLNSIADD